MINFIRGTVTYQTTEFVVLDVGGVGFRVLTSSSDALMVKIGEETTMFTDMVVREDAMFLVGFLHEQKLEMYKLLTSVNGIGPKVAIGILSSLSYDEIISSVMDGNKIMLARAQGVGKKVAERIVLELRDKVKNLTKNTETEVTEVSAGDDDALSALMSLGYTKGEAVSALSKIDMSKNITTDQIIRQALGMLMR